MRRGLVSAVAAVLAAAAATSGCTDGDDRPVDRLVVAAGASGSVDADVVRAYAEAVRDRWHVAVDVVETTGRVENVTLVGRGEADLAITTADLAELAVQGDPPYPGPQPVVALAGLYEDFLHVVVPATSPVERLRDLSGRRVSLGDPMSGTRIAAERALLAAGCSLSDFRVRQLSPADSAEALRGGRLDAFFLLGGLPTPVVSQLAGRLDIRLLSLRDEATTLRDQIGEYYYGRSIPAGTYPLAPRRATDAGVTTVAVPNVLIVRRDLPDRVAYALTDLLFAAKDRLVAAHPEVRRLDHRSALAVFPLPLHRGARRYYQAAKPMAASRASPFGP